MSRASCPVFAMRAWHSTCLPASRVASVRVRCIYGHVPIRTASTPSSRARQRRPTIESLGIPTAGRPRNIELVRDSLARLKTAIRHRDDLASRDTSKGRKHHVTNVRTRPDDPDTDRTLYRPPPRCPLGAELGGSGGSHKRESSHGKKRSAIQSPSSLAIESVAHFRLCTRRVGRVPNECTKPGRSSSRSAYRGVELHARLD